MKLKISDIFKRKHAILEDKSHTQGWRWEDRKNFGRLIWVNAVEILTDLCNDVTFFTADRTKLNQFAEFKVFFSTSAELVLMRYFTRGYCVIAYENMRGFSVLDENDYKVVFSGNTKKIEPKNPNHEIYVMRSPIYTETELSDKDMVRPALELIDNALNASNTCSARLGSLVVASPSTPNAMPTPMVLTDEQKEKMEKELSREYGSLSSQKQLMLLKRGMNFQVVNLAGIDARTLEKVKIGICMVADRLKIPANQIALIDAMSNKTLANGSELREGDFNKYQTFERLLSRTFIQLAYDCGMKVDYVIYNKPIRQQQ